MLILIVFAVSLLLAYKAMSAGLLTALSHLLTGALAIAAGVGFAGPLRAQIPSDNAYLFGCGLVMITVAAYGFLRVLVSYYMLEREVLLPGLIDRVGAAAVGFIGGMMLCGAVCMAMLAFPLPGFARGAQEQISRSAELGFAAVRTVALFAGTDQPIIRRNVYPRPAEPASTSSAVMYDAPGKPVEDASGATSQ